MIRIIATIILVVGGLSLLFKITSLLIDKNPKKKILILSTALLIGIAMVILIPILLFPTTNHEVLGLYSTIEKSLVETLGISPWLARGILTIAFIPFIYFGKRLFSFDKSKRRSARLLLSFYTGGYYLAMFFLTQNIYFAHGTGEAIKYYAVTPEGYRFFDSPGYDPKYGIKLDSVTPDIARQYQIQKGLPISNAPANPDTISVYFNRFTGESTKWYAQLQDGSYEFFGNSGYHPKYGTLLKPVTADVLQEIESQKKKLQSINEQEATKQEFQLKLSKYINESANKLASKKSILVVVVEKDSNKQNSDYETTMKTLLGEKGLLACNGLFRPAFFTDGHFANLIRGQTQILHELSVSGYVDYLLLIEQQTASSENEQLEGLISSKITLDYQLMSSVGEQINSGSLSEPGIGTNEINAERKALSNIVDKLLPKLKAL